MSVEMSVTLPNSDTPIDPSILGPFSTSRQGPYFPIGIWGSRLLASQKPRNYADFGYLLSEKTRFERWHPWSDPNSEKTTMQFLTTDDTAAYLKVSKSTILRLIRNRDLDVTRIGRSVRISKKSIEKFVDAHTTYGRIPKGRS